MRNENLVNKNTVTHLLQIQAYRQTLGAPPTVRDTLSACFLGERHGPYPGWNGRLWGGPMFYWSFFFILYVDWPWTGSMRSSVEESLFSLSTRLAPTEWTLTLEISSRIPNTVSFSKSVSVFPPSWHSFHLDWFCFLYPTYYNALQSSWVSVVN